MSKGSKTLLYVFLMLIVAGGTVLGAVSLQKKSKQNLRANTDFAESYSTKSAELENTSDVMLSMTPEQEDSASEHQTTETVSATDVSESEVEENQNFEQSSETAEKIESETTLSSESQTSTENTTVENVTENVTQEEQKNKDDTDEDRSWANRWIRDLDAITFVPDYKEDELMDFKKLLSSLDSENIDLSLFLSEEDYLKMQSEADSNSQTTDALPENHWAMSAGGVSYLDTDFIKTYFTRNGGAKRFSVYVEDMTTGEVYQYNPEGIYNVASTIKPAIAMLYYNLAKEGKVNLSEYVKYLEKKDYEGGAGILLNSIEDGDTQKVSDLLSLMIVHSDNIATNMLLRNLYAKIGYDGYKNGMVLMLGMKYHGQNYKASTMASSIEYFCRNYANNTYYKDLLGYMENTNFNGYITRALPKGSFFHKYGSFMVEGRSYSGDIGVIYGKYPLVFSVYTENANVEPSKLMEETGKYLYFIAQTGIFPKHVKSSLVQ